MISIEKEKQIRLLLKSGISRRKTAQEVGVGRTTVNLIAKLPKLRHRKKPRKKLLRLRKKRKCRKCGGDVKTWPCLLCHPKAGFYDDFNILQQQGNATLTSEVSELFRIVNDLHELHKLKLIPHILFRELARRAEKSLERISNANK